MWAGHRPLQRSSKTGSASSSVEAQSRSAAGRIPLRELWEYVKLWFVRFCFFFLKKRPGIPGSFLLIYDVLNGRLRNKWLISAAFRCIVECKSANVAHGQFPIIQLFFSGVFNSVDGDIQPIGEVISVFWFDFQ